MLYIRSIVTPNPHQYLKNTGYPQTNISLYIASKYVTLDLLCLKPIYLYLKLTFS